MLDDHAKVAIAQIAFYTPAIALAAFLLTYRHGKPRMAWLLLLTFSLVRLAGGITMIISKNNPGNVGANVASIVLEGVGIMPLLLSTIGLLRIILAVDFEQNRYLRWTIVIPRILFAIGVGMLIAGGVIPGDCSHQSSVALGESFIKAGYIFVALVFAVLIVVQGYLWTQKTKISRTSTTILKGLTFGMPFLLVRIIYAFLSAFDVDPLRSKWNYINGDLAAFVAMALLMEYVVVVDYIWVGMVIPPTRHGKGSKGGNNAFDSAG